MTRTIQCCHPLDDCTRSAPPLKFESSASQLADSASAGRVRAGSSQAGISFSWFEEQHACPASRPQGTTLKSAHGRDADA